LSESFHQKTIARGNTTLVDMESTIGPLSVQIDSKVSLNSSLK